MKIERIPVTAIVEGVNPRLDLQPGDSRYEALKASIDRWDSVQPLVWNRRTGHLVGGHQRLKLLVARGDTDVDVSVVDLPPSEETALNIALNKIEGAWDKPKLFEALSDLSLDVRLTGFDLAELATLAADLDKDRQLFAPNLEPAVPTVVAEPVTQAAVTHAEDHEASRFGPRKVQDLTCPYCGETFGVGETTSK